MRNNDTYTVVYAAGICLISSLLLAVTASGLRQQQERMAESDRKFNVLKSFQADVFRPDGGRIGVEQIEEMYANHVAEGLYSPASGELLDPNKKQEMKSGPVASDALPVYRWTDEGQVSKYAIPISGSGLWGPIYGYLALDRGLETIIGVSFYRHQETPGLGAEIEKSSFTQPFQGQKIFKNDSLRIVEVVKGRVADRYPSGAPGVAVDGISGATITGRGVSTFMTRNLQSYDRVFRALRKN